MTRSAVQQMKCSSTDSSKHNTRHKCKFQDGSIPVLLDNDKENAHKELLLSLLLFFLFFFSFSAPSSFFFLHLIIGETIISLSHAQLEETYFTEGEEVFTKKQFIFLFFFSFHLSINSLRRGGGVERMEEFLDG